MSSENQEVATPAAPEASGAKCGIVWRSYTKNSKCKC